MDNKLLRSLSEKENYCKNLQRQADEIYRNNGRVYSYDQCTLLQRAADLESEMAQLTINEERNHHIKNKNALDYEIMRIRSELDKKNGVKQAPAAGKGEEPKLNKNTNNAASAGSKETDEIARTVSTWFNKEAPRHSFEDVSGMTELKKKLSSIISDAKSGNLMDYLKIPRLNSYFFVGPPGCGKTYIIEAFAHELMEQDYEFVSLQGSDIISRYVGAAEKSVTLLFEEIAKRPCIVFIDEIDSLCKNRSLPNLPEYAANITTSFLTGYNRIHSADSNVIFIAATNYPDRVDAAMLDRVEIIRVPLPDTEAREFAFEKHFKDIIKLYDITFREMAQMTKRCNYRDIERLATLIKKEMFKFAIDRYKNEDTAIEMFKNGSIMLTKARFTEILRRFVPSPKEAMLNDLKNWEKSVQAITEANDDEIEYIYEPADNDDIPTHSAETAPAAEPAAAEPSAPVVPISDTFARDSATGEVNVRFKVYPADRADIKVSINYDDADVTADDDGYSVKYSPAATVTELRVEVFDAEGYVGSFTAKLS